MKRLARMDWADLHYSTSRLLAHPTIRMGKVISYVSISRGLP